MFIHYGLHNIHLGLLTGHDILGLLDDCMIVVWVVLNNQIGNIKLSKLDHPYQSITKDISTLKYKLTGHRIKWMVYFTTR